jgi:hypothetical protein
MGSDASVPFTYAEIRPYAVADSLDELPELRRAG